MKLNHEELIGQRFGHIIILSCFYKPNKIGNNSTYVLGQCDCRSQPKEYYYQSLRRGETKSCGCYNVSLVKARSTTHGKTNTRVYHIWNMMKQRCYNQYNEHYKGYGGRGITVCEDWKSDFQSFYDWAMSNGYVAHLSIDRINNDGNYCPNNCRWSTMKEQCNNTRRNHLIELNGEIKTLSEWCDIYDIKYQTVWRRIKLGWDTSKLFDPVVRCCDG